MDHKQVESDQPRLAVQGPDGIYRSEKIEFQLNAAFAKALGFSDEGKIVLDHIRSISLDLVNGPEANQLQLAHREGMRFLAMVIIERVKRGTGQGT